MEVVLGLGSNLGDRAAALESAIRRIAALPGVTALERGGIYETAPVDPPAGMPVPAFLNTVVVLQYDGDGPRELWEALRSIEAEGGRRRSGVRNEPRTIDIDVIYVEGVRQDDPELTLPHPRAASRAFVLAPLADVRPGLRLSPTDVTVAERLSALRGVQKVVRFHP